MVSVVRQQAQRSTEKRAWHIATRCPALKYTYLRHREEELYFRPFDLGDGERYAGLLLDVVHCKLHDLLKMLFEQVFQ